MRTFSAEDEFVEGMIIQGVSCSTAMETLRNKANIVSA